MNGLCVVLEDVKLDVNHLKSGSGKRFFGGVLSGFWVLVGSPGGHGWVTHPQGLRMGWADAEKLVCVQILRMYNWFLTV